MLGHELAQRAVLDGYTTAGLQTAPHRQLHTGRIIRRTVLAEIAVWKVRQKNRGELRRVVLRTVFRLWKVFEHPLAERTIDVGIHWCRGSRRGGGAC